jgi:integrase
MSSITKNGSGYRVQVYVKGQRDSATFPNKKEAQLWAAEKEIEFQAIAKGQASKTTTTHQALAKYRDEISPKHKGERWERVRLDKMIREFPLVMLDKLTSDHVIKWLNGRKAEVKESSALREMKLLNSVFEQCKTKEWKLLVDNPCSGVTRPKESAHRTRLISYLETRQILRALNFPQRTLPRHAVAHAFLLALLTGMRQGELASITWANVKPNYIHLPDTKNETARDVPLSAMAKAVVQRMRGYHAESMFNISAGSIDTHFRNARDRAGLAGFTWHDTRHTAATRIGRSGKLQLLELCKMFGWKDPKMALVYFNPTGDDLAAKL